MMDMDKILKVIEKELSESNAVYLKTLCKEKLGSFLEETSRFTKLVKWIDKERDLLKISISLFTPAWRDGQEYKKSYFNNYMNALKDWAFLTAMKDLLVSDGTSNNDRNNIEYTLCKIYNIHYSEQLKIYV